MIMFLCFFVIIALYIIYKGKKDEEYEARYYREFSDEIQSLDKLEPAPKKGVEKE